MLVMAHLPKVGHYYAVYIGWPTSSLPYLFIFLLISSTPSLPLLHSILSSTPSPLLSSTPSPLLSSGDLLLLLLSGDLLPLLSGELLLTPLRRTRSGELLLPSGDVGELLSGDLLLPPLLLTVSPLPSSPANSSPVN